MKAVVSFSGGMDSTTVLAAAIEAHGAHDVCAVGFSYGSKHNSYENAAAKRICAHYSVPFKLIALDEAMSAFQSNLMAKGGPIPEGHYEAETMSQTVVPGRNIIFASLLAGYAWSIGADEVWLGIHQGDHAIYPDCRPEFFDAMSKAIEVGTDKRVTLQAPFLHGTKTTIINYGRTVGVPYHLTRTCYKDQPVACGKCGACQERLEAFANNGIDDPVDYESREILPTA